MSTIWSTNSNMCNKITYKFNINSNGTMEIDY